MKKIVCISIFSLTGSYAFAQNDFRHEFAQYDSLAADRARLVHHGVVTPLWVNATVFCYETQEATG